MDGAHGSGVVRFYDTHPINEDEILAKLVARGVDLDALTQDELKEFDQDHYAGIQVVDILAEQAGVRREHHVLDVCSGMGGPARWMAHRIGCRVTGLDFTPSRVESARRLTRRVRLDHLVDFVQGDATDMPLPDAAYDVVISQESWLHVPDKAAVIAQCRRVLKARGVIAFTDITLRAPLTAKEESRMASQMQAPRVAPVTSYLELLQAHGFAIQACDDLSQQWSRVLVDRLSMYRSLRDTTIAKFGAAHYQAWDATYDFFVGLFTAGKLGGSRIVAAKMPA
jgi:sarcosine/dimethylglycine N-methyltransferase